jgi:hypothetical protein
MKHLKMLGLAIMAAAALTALLGAGTASATELCSTNTSPCTGTMYPAGTEIEATLTGTAKLETTGGTTLDECKEGGVKGTTSNTGGSGESETVIGSIPASGLTWVKCTFTTTTTVGGELEIHTDTPGVPDGNGTLTARGFEVSIPTIFGTCTYGFGTEAHDLGTLKGGSPATIEINTLVPRLSGPCPEQARWKANYKVVKPTSLYVQ